MYGYIVMWGLTLDSFSNSFADGGGGVIHYWESQHRSNTWFRDAEVGLSIKIEAIRHDFYE